MSASRRKPLPSRVQELRQATGASASCGWMVDEVCWLLYGLIRFYQPTLVIQTGHLWGKSALVVLEALRWQPVDRDESMGDPAYAEFVADNSPHRSRGRLVSIDPHPDGVRNPAAGVALLHSWYPNFTHIETTSASFFSHFEVAPEERVFGIVDGDHTAHGATADLTALVKLGARMIFLDDTSWIPHLKDVGEDIGYISMQFPEYNGVMLLGEAVVRFWFSYWRLRIHRRWLMVWYGIPGDALKKPARPR